jgi:acyl carrier protein
MNDINRQLLINYILHDVIHRPNVQIDEDTPLVSSGLIDSFALVDILIKLQDVTGRRIPASKVQAKDMDTVRLMFQTADRVGKPRS